MTRDEILILIDKNQIGISLDDFESIDVIENYVNNGVETANILGNELIGLDSDIDEAADTAEKAYNNSVAAVKASAAAVRALLDEWGKRSYLRDFTFSFSDGAKAFLRKSFSDLCELLHNEVSVLSSASGMAADAASMLRECASNASSIASKLKLASVAARICDRNELDSELIGYSEETKERAVAAELLVSELMGLIRSITTVILAISTAIPNASAALQIDDDGSEKMSKLISPQRAATALSGIITSIDSAKPDAEL